MSVDDFHVVSQNPISTGPFLRERVTAMAERGGRRTKREEKSDDSARYEIGLEDLELLPPTMAGLDLGREVGWL